jgi:hypothetical protein
VLVEAVAGAACPPCPEGQFPPEVFGAKMKDGTQW